MMRHRQSTFIALLLLLILAPTFVRAADVLQEVPNDALGFVAVHHLGDLDAKIKSLSSDLRNNVFSPLGFMKAVTGIQDGLDPNGDSLLVVYKDAGGDNSQIRYGIWLPVADYARLIKSIGATSNDGVAAATVAGEDLLVAHRGEWAIVMDPDQRERMTQLVSAAPSPPPQIAAWKKWIDDNDVTFVAFESGVHELLSRIDEADENGKSGNESSDNLFGSRGTAGRGNVLVATGAHRPSPDGLAGAINEFHKWTAASPEFARAIQQTNMVGCGLRLNFDGSQRGNVRARLRVALDDTIQIPPLGADGDLPFSIYENGGFVIHGAGRLPNSVFVGLASAYLRRFADDLKTEERTELDEESLKQLNDAVEQAANDVRSALVLTQPGAQPQPAYSNDFILLRVASASEFFNHAAEVMRLWNKANRDAHGETHLVFESEESKIGGRTATQYSLDMVAIAGDPVLPEIRQIMEKLFGPGGRLRLWIVPADDRTVLLARGTAGQVAAALKALDRKQPVDWNRGESSECSRLLNESPTTTWRVFFDPHRYYDWQQREAAAMTCVPIIGGPLVRPFRDCPPVGIAGGFQGNEISIEMVALEPTIKSAYEYATSASKRPQVQRRLQPAPR